MAEAVSSSVILQQFLDTKTGNLTWMAQKLLQQWQKQLAGGFDAQGNLISNLTPGIQISGRRGTIATILANISAVGVVLPSGMSSATPTAQGAVLLPVGATGNTLGSAAMEPATAFDAAGSSSTAQTAAETFAAVQAAAAQSNAETFASNASNLSSGLVPLARLSGISIVVTTAALTTLGAQGSMTFSNGLLTAQVQAT